MAAPKKIPARRAKAKNAPQPAALLLESIKHYKSAIALHRKLLDAHEALLDGFHEHLAAMRGGFAPLEAINYHPGVHACIARVSGKKQFSADTSLRTLRADPGLVQGCVFETFGRRIGVDGDDTEDTIVSTLES